MINFPDYPIYTTTYQIETPVSINVTLGATTYPTVAIPAGAYWGYISDGTGVGASLDVTDDSSYPSLHATLAQAIVDCLADPAKFNLTAPTLTLYYRKATSPEPRLIVDYNRSGAGFAGTNVTITFDTLANAKIFGHSTTTDLAWNTLTDLASTDINFAGYWYNRDLTVLEEEWSTSQTNSSESIYGSVFNQIKWGATRKNKMHMHPIIWAAMIFLYRRQDTGFSTPYGLNVADPNNLLEEFIQDCIDNDFLCYYDDTDVDLCRFMNDEMFSDIRTILEDLASGRVFGATIPFRVKTQGVTIAGTNVYVG